MPDKILFIGHSLVGQDMPQMLNSVFTTLGRDVDADIQVINGAPLRYNWDHGSSAQGVNARSALVDGSYDVVVVSEGFPLDSHLMWSDTHGYAARYFDLATSANPGTRFYIYETWHSLGGDVAAWRAQIDQDLSKWEGIADHINSNAAVGLPDALIVPAGQAMARLYDAIEAGRVPGLTSIRDVFSDDIHLNDLGNWFIAGLQAATLAQISPSDIPAATANPYGVSFDVPGAATAGALKGIIQETLSAYDRDGVADTGTWSPADDGKAVDDDAGGTDDDTAADNGADTGTKEGTPFAGEILTSPAPDELTTITELYIAYFDRAPASTGLLYWATRLEDGMSLPEIAESFFVQPETQRTYDAFLDKYGNLTDTQAFVTAVFNNVLGRDPTSPYWVNELGNNPAITPATFILAVLNGAKAVTGGAMDAAYLEAKTDIGVYFAAIKGLSDYDDTVSVMEMFDGSAASVTAAVSEIDRLHTEASSSDAGDFLMPLVGIIDDPFNIV